MHEYGYLKRFFGSTRLSFITNTGSVREETWRVSHKSLFSKVKTEKKPSSWADRALCSTIEQNSAKTKSAAQLERLNCFLNMQTERNEWHQVIISSETTAAHICPAACALSSHRAADSLHIICCLWCSFSHPHCVFTSAPVAAGCNGRMRAR